MIVIYTPYGRGETTAAAIRLAELAVAAALPTRLVSVGPHEDTVHPFWDSRVVCGRNDGIQTAAKGATICIWFVYGEYLRRTAAGVAPKAAHVYVPPWHSQPKPSYDGMPPYEQIVCPSKHQQEAFISRVVPANQGHTHVTWARWDAGFPAVKHDGRSRDGKIRVLAHCDVGTIDECPAVAIRIMEGLLEACDHVEITCWSSKAWARRERRKLAEMRADRPDRFWLIHGGDLQAQLTHMHSHDWFLYPAVRTDFAMQPVRAMHCGLPVIAWDIPPISEHVRTDYSGVIVPCEISANWSNAPTAAASASKFIATVEPYLNNVSALLDMQRSEWALRARSEAFQSFWLELFGAADR